MTGSFPTFFFPLSHSTERRAHDEQTRTSKTRLLLTNPQGPAPFSFLRMQTSYPPTD